MSRGDEQAFPIPVSDNGTFGTNGLTLREYYAGLAMQGLSALPGRIDWKAGMIADLAVEQADALLAALAKEPPRG